MKSNRNILLAAALFVLALPAVAQDGSTAPVAPQLEPPACSGFTPTLPALGTPEVIPVLGGTRACSAFLADGSPNPDWPDCNSTDGGSVGGSSCDGIGTCYCVCRYNHRCDLDASECDPLTQCLNDCDAQYPGCPYPGGGYPSSLAECF